MLAIEGEAKGRYIVAQMEPSSMADPDRIRRKKLLYRSWHRGTREADLILGSFAERHLAGFDARQLDEFERVLETADGELYDWIAGRARPPDERCSEVMRLLLQFRYWDRP
jgi:antitoxin CptB